MPLHPKPYKHSELGGSGILEIQSFSLEPSRVVDLLKKLSSERDRIVLVHLELFKGLHRASVDSDLHPTVTAFGQSAEACYLPSAAFLTCFRATRPAKHDYLEMVGERHGLWWEDFCNLCRHVVSTVG